MKLALLCDTHFGAKSDSKIFLKHQETFFKEIFFPYLKSNQIDTIIHLGDVFDRRKYINFFTLSESKRFFFDILKREKLNMHVILGNHDTFYINTNEINSVTILLQEYSEFIKIYERGLHSLKFDNLDLLLCPWIIKEDLDTILTDIKKSNANVLLGHFDIKGFEMMKGILSEHGYDQKDFSQFEAVYSGHYHHQSQYGNIKYLGSQYEMNWSDYGSKKGFHVLDTVTKELTFVENPNRIFHKLEYDDTDLSIDDIQALDVSLLKNTYIKVLVKNRTNSYLFDLFLTKLNDSGAADVKTIESDLYLNSDSKFETLLKETKDTKDIFYSYIDSIETNIDKRKIKLAIDELYIEAMNIL